MAKENMDSKKVLLTNDNIEYSEKRPVRVMQIKTDELLITADRMGMEFDYEDGEDDGGMY